MMISRFKTLPLWLAAAITLFSASSEAKEPNSIKGAILQTEIRTAPAQGGLTNPERYGFEEAKNEVQEMYAGRIKPGTKMRLQAVVKNIGDILSAPGDIEIVFAYPPSIHREPATLFATETVDLPAIPPGEYRVVNFAGLHLWPSLFDFIRQEWAMREYQAVVTIQGYREITGTREIAYTAYYHEGPAHEAAVRVSSANHEPAW